MNTKCPHCGQHYHVDASTAGQAAQCSACYKEFVIAAEPAISASAPSYDGAPTSNKELMRRARESLKGNWTNCVLAVFVVGVISSTVAFGVSFAVNFLPSLLISLVADYESMGFALISTALEIIDNLITYLLLAPFLLSMAILFLCVVRRGKAEIGQIFSGFANFWRAFRLCFLMNLFIMLWTLLLIIPGIIAAYSYAMCFYVLADNPEIGAREALRRSKEMMRGRKWKLFCLGIRFIGWALLCLLTCGIGFLWLGSYVSASFAYFYENAKANANGTAQ